LLHVLFFLWTLTDSVGVLAYVILWIILPEKEAAGQRREDVLRHNIRELGSQATGFARDLRKVLTGVHEIQIMSTSHIILLGGLSVLLGLRFLVDSLHLLGWFRLDQLSPVVLSLTGAVMLNRALRV
jgi:hypothetical protein